MPTALQSRSPTPPPNIRVDTFSLRKATGHLLLDSIVNQCYGVPTRQVPTCQVANVLGERHQHAYGCAMEHALNVMSQSTLSDADARAVEQFMSWLAPNQGERLGNPVLRRTTALGVMHAAVNELLKADKSNQTLIECEIKLRQSLVDIAVASGKCKSPPQGGDAGGRTRLVAEHLTKAGECLRQCASVLDTQSFAGAVVRAVLPEALTEAIGDRLGAQVEKLKGQGETSLEVIKVLNANAEEKVRAAVQHLTCSDNFESVQNGILMLLEIPELVIQGQPGAQESKGPDNAVDRQPPAIPRELLDRAGGGPILYNNSPTNIDFSKLAKALGGGGLNLESLGNLLDRAREDGYRVGRVEAENERLLAVAEKQQVTIQKKNDCISRLQEELKEKNAQLSKWMNGFGNGEPGVDRGTQKDAIYGSYASTEVGKRSAVDSEFARRPPVPLVTPDMRGISSQHSEAIYDIPDLSIPEAIYANVGDNLGKEREFSQAIVSHTAKPLTPVFTRLQMGGSERATETEVYSSVASSMSDPSEHDRESVDYVNTRWNRSRNSSGSSMGRGDLPQMSMLEEFEQVIKKKGPGEEYERYSYPHATVLNAKGFKEQLLSQVRSSDSDSDSVGAEQRVGFEIGHSPSARLKKLFESSEQRVSMRAQRSVHTPHASNLLRSLGSAGQSVSDDGSSQVSDDVPEFIKVLNELKQRPRVYSNSLANGSEQFPKDGRRW